MLRADPKLITHKTQIVAQFTHCDAHEDGDTSYHMRTTSCKCHTQKKRKAAAPVSATSSEAKAVVSTATKSKSEIDTEEKNVKRARKTLPPAAVFCCAQCKHDCLVCWRQAFYCEHYSALSAQDTLMKSHAAIYVGAADAHETNGFATA